MDYFLQQLINGLTLGSIYALVAIGYTMVYGIIGMINFAHGDIFMVGAFLALIAYRPLRGSFRLAPLISAIGMSIFLQNYVQIAQGARVKSLPPLVPGAYVLMDDGKFVVQLTNIQIIIIVTT